MASGGVVAAAAAGKRRRGRRWPKWLGIVVLAVIALFWWAQVPDLPAAELKAKYARAGDLFVEVEPGLEVHIRDEGPKDAPALVLLHGSNSSLQTWEPWAAQLKDRYRIISYDQPGHGLTGAHPRADYSAAAFVRVLDVVAANRGLTKFALAGNSMGGWVAWNYALAHPDKLSALILVDAAGAPVKSTGTPIGFRIARTPVVRDLIGNLTPRIIIEKSLEDTLYDRKQVTPAMVDRYWELLRYPGNRKATLDRSRTERGQVAQSALAAIKVPTLLMWGREDSLIPVSGAAWFAKGIPGAKTVIYDRIGHIPMQETPDKSAADVDAFLSAQSPISEVSRVSGIVQ